MWRQLLGGGAPAQQPTKGEEEPPKALRPKPTTETSSGFFDPPKLPPSPRTLDRKRQQQEASKGASASPTLTDKTTVEDDTEAAAATKETSVNENESPVDQIVPQSPESSELLTEPVGWATSPAKKSHISVEESDTHRNLDMRKARLDNSEFFMEGIKMIEAERQKEIADKLEETSSLIQQQSNSPSGMAVFVRKRPIDESEKEDYDVIRVESAASANPVVVVYNTQMEWATKTKTIKPVTFGAQGVFDEHKTSADVYYQAVKPLVEDTKNNGGIGTVLMYGQSGSGKSHTMASVLSMAARDAFTGLPQNYTVKVSYVEIVGKECRDLLDETPSPVRIADNEDGSVRFVNARLVTVPTPEDLQDAMVNAKKRQKYKTSLVEESDTSGGSSLSHAVCRIVIVPPKDVPDNKQPGSLTLVDCAGTELRIGHDRRWQAERAEINASLWALKQCIRTKKNCENTTNPSDRKNPPYEYSSLTRILRESLENKHASFHIIATISPMATDTEHTIDTLLMVTNVVEGSIDELTAEHQADPSSSLNDAENIPPPPKAWERSQLMHWLVKKHLIQKGSSIPEDMTGRRVMRMSKKELQGTFYGKDDSQKADLLYRCLRAETDRIARLDVKRRMAIEIAARKGTGGVK